MPMQNNFEISESVNNEANIAAFSTDYLMARDRFRTAAKGANCTLESLQIDHPGPDGQSLTIDVARLGAIQPEKIVVVSSGLHGVEGFFGSAVQLALLQRYLPSLAKDQTLILLHALNPYGFFYLRRSNEDNVDLNRNFLLPGELYQGSPDGYAQLNSFLNSQSPPARLNLFYPKAIATIVKAGFAQLKVILASGQYDFPQGLFFGGHGPTKTQQLLVENLPRWLQDATRVIHLDLHTGLGTWGTCKLLTSAPNSERLQRLRGWFSPEVIESPDSGTAYPIRGGLEDWCQNQFPERQYDLLTAEFGTYPSIQVVEALRSENQAHWWGNSTHQHWTKQRIKEVFAPADPQWRSQVLAKAVALIQQAVQVMSLD